MSHIVDLLTQGGTVVLPSPERPASISIIEICGEQYVRLAVEVSRSSLVTRIVRLRDVSGFHKGPFQCESGARTKWARCERAQEKLRDGCDNLTGFVAVHKDAQILLQVEIGTSALESIAAEELVMQQSYTRSSTCDGCCCRKR
jgi:hypothetical protein